MLVVALERYIVYANHRSFQV